MWIINLLLLCQIGKRGVARAHHIFTIAFGAPYTHHRCHWSKLSVLHVYPMNPRFLVGFEGMGVAQLLQIIFCWMSQLIDKMFPFELSIDFSRPMYSGNFPLLLLAIFYESENRFYFCTSVFVLPLYSAWVAFETNNHTVRRIDWIMLIYVYYCRWFNFYTLGELHTRQQRAKRTE